MKKFILFGIILICLGIIFVGYAVVKVTGSDLTNAHYKGLIYISNNGTAATGVSCNVSGISSSALIAAGYIDSDCDNVAITNGSDVPFMPGYGTAPWMIFIDSIGANATLSYSFYTGNATLSSTKYYFPFVSNDWGDISDNPSLELGANYTIEMYGYFDASKAGSFIYKNAAIQIDMSAANTVRMYHYGSATDLTASMTSGLHKMEFYQNATSTNMTIEMDDTVIGSMDCASTAIPNNANAWQVCGRGSGYNSAAMYLDYIKIYVGGELRGYWYWEYAATFTDHGDDATSCPLAPAYPGTSSDADVSGYLATFEPIDTATAPETTVQDAPDFLSGNITATGNFTLGNIHSLGGPPGAEAIEQIATETNTPLPWAYGVLGMVTISVFGLGMSYARKRYSISGGYVLAAIIVPLAVIGLFVTFGKFDWWMIWYYLIIAAGIAMASRHIDWGGATSQHSIIGFLAMSWIGLTLINRIMEGAFLSSAETAWINSVSFTQNFNFLNLFFIPIMNFQFFTEGIPAMMRWDYSFFGGQAQIIGYMLYSITAVVSFILFGILLGLIYSAFSRSRV